MTIQKIENVYQATEQDPTAHWRKIEIISKTRQDAINKLFEALQCPHYLVRSYGSRTMHCVACDYQITED